MKKVYFSLFIACLSCFALNAVAQSITQFNYTGSVQTYTVPACVNSIFVDAQGAPGGMGGYSSYPQPGGRGGRVQCTIAVTPGQVLNIYVGGTGGNRFNTSSGSGTSLAGGYNGGGNGWGYYCGSGGGRTDIRIGGTTFPTNAVVVAGGGGGAGYSTSTAGIGGDGGGTTGAMGYYSGSQNSCYCGAGGGTSSGGVGATCYYSGSSGAGSQGQGGNATMGSYAGGGGGGWYGGGCGYSGSGGGGSSYTSSTLCSNVTHTQGFNGRVGGGSVTIYTSAAKAFSYTGAVQTYTVPSGVTKVNVDLVGAKGGRGGTSATSSYGHFEGGKGGRVQCDLSVTPGQVLNVYVGGVGSTLVGSCCSGTATGGYNGGGNGYYGYSGGGGGKTDIRTGGTTFPANAVVVAGGGGGASYNCSTSKMAGGDGGGLTGGDGFYCGNFNTSYSGRGGTQTAGGTVGSAYPQSSGAGTQGQGGSATNYYYPGGGGGGWWGGSCAASYAGGGGGSSYTSPAVTSNVIHTQGYNTVATGNGFAVITPLYPTVIVDPGSLAFGLVTNGSTSTPQFISYTASALNAGGALTITPPANFQVSPDGITWYTNTTPYVIAYSVSDFSGSLFVRFAPTALTSYSANMVISGGGMSCSMNLPLTGTGANGCTSTPSTGTITINGTSSITGNSSTICNLAAPSATTGGGIAYQWQISTTSSSSGFNNIPGANTIPYAYSGLPATSWFRLVVTCGSLTATSGAVTATFSMPNSSCVPTCGSASFTSYYIGTTGNPYMVTGASSTSISDASVSGSGTGGSTRYYNNVSSYSVTFNPGGSYNSTMGHPTASYQSGQVWIDYNDNGAFDPSESVGGYAFLSSTGPTNPGGVRPTPVLTIPLTAKPGRHRMRALNGYEGNNLPGASLNYPCYPLMEPCPTSTVQYADVRDYTAIIVPATPVLTATTLPNFGNVLVGSSTVPVGFSELNGSNLVPAAGYITITAPNTNFKVSVDGVSWGSSVFLGYSGGSITNRNIYVQFTPAAATSSSGNVTITGGGLASTVNVAVGGTGHATACSGAPSTGSIAVSPTSGSGTTQFTLSLSGTTAVAGLFYQWQSSPNGTTWTNIATGIYPSCTFTGIHANTQFRCIVSCGAGGSATSSTATATYASSGGSLPSPSCTGPWSSASAACSTYQMWLRVAITGASGAIADAASCNGTGYLDQTGLAAPTFNAGGTYSMTCTTGPSYSQYDQVWIDFNNNGTFETTESVGGQSTTTSAIVNYTFNIVIPSGVATGTFRMRVRGSYYGNGVSYPNISPCTSYSYGETRDYKVNILGGAPQCSGTPKASVVSATPFTSCNGFTSSMFNVGVTSAPGITYQWQSSSSPTSGFTNVSGATNATYFPSVSSIGTVYYRDVVTCVPSGMSTASNTQALTYLAPPAAITGNTTICNGSTSTLASATSGVSWSSSATSVATVGSSSGVVTGISPGTATIICTAPSGCITTATVNILPQPAAISGTLSVCGGGGPTSVTLTNATSGGTWTSSSSGLATIGSTSGVVTGVSAGNPVISYTLPTGCRSTATMTVNAVPDITGLTSVCLGYSTVIGNTMGGGTWSSSNNSVATINSSGVVNSVSVGSTTISYTVSSIGCAAVRSQFVTNPPSFYSVSGGGTYCAGGTGVHVGMAGTDAGISYQLYNGVTPVATMIGTGGSIDFGLFTGAGTYGVIANPGTPCSATMTGTVVVNVNALPTPFTVSGGGAYCAGGTGVNIYLNSSTIGVNYQLMLGSTSIGSPVAGTSAALNMGLVTTPGTYTVVGTNATTTCSGNMSGSVTVSINSLPTAFSVTGSAGYCAGGSGVPVGLSGSVAGTTYQLMLGSTAVGFPVSGTGSNISFGSMTTGGSYTVVATNTATGCVGNMSGSATVVVNPLPTPFSLTGGGAYCSGSTAGVPVGITGSTAGVNYQLYSTVGTTTTAVGAAVPGTGAALGLGVQLIPAAYTVIATNVTTGCVSNMLGSVTVSVNPLPTPYTVTGGGQYCAGGSGLAVGLSGSATGITYQLFNSGTLVGAGAGTGGAVSFGLQLAAGVYTVTAVNTTTGCIANMTGSVTITINTPPAVYNITQTTTSYCAGGTGVAIGLSGSASGVSYRLYNAGVPMGSAVSGTGSTITFGSQTVAGSYTAVAVNTSTTCSSNMSGIGTVNINPLPTVHALTGGGTYCAGGIGVHVGLSSSNTGISYRLYRGGTPTGAPLAGTGTALDYGVFSTTGTYTIIATNPASGCVSNMAGGAVVSSNPLPAQYNVEGGGSYCTGGAGQVVRIDNSDAGIDYQLFNGTTAVGPSVPGTGSLLSFGLQTAPGTYTVVATDAATGCMNNMTGSTTISINPLPTPFVVSGGGNYCSGGTGVNVALLGSTAGINYDLMNGTTLVSSLMGTGGVISFGLQTAAGTYSVVATNTATTCVRNMTGTVSVTINPGPTAYAVTGGGNYCTGSTGVPTGLAGSALGTNYQLYNGTVAVGIAMPGTGSAISFGIHTAPGIYTVKATNTITGCTANMPGSAIVIVNPLPVLHTVTGGGNFCTGGAGVHVNLSGSTTGVNYQLYNGAVAVGAALAGTSGVPLDFGIQTGLGIYTVVATNTATGCVNNMTGSAMVGVHPLPAVYTVVGGGNYCSGGAGVSVALSGSNTGITYQLWNGSVAVGGPVSGTGLALNFGLQTGAGTYMVSAVNATTGCTSNMSGSAFVGVSALPTQHTVTGGGNYCAGSTGISIGLSGSNLGTTYRLYNSGSPVGAAIAGAGAPLDFGIQSAPGVYSVVATNTATSCVSSMTGSAAIGVDPLPTAYTVNGGGNYCAGGTGVHVVTGSSDAGINYQLYLGSSAVGGPIAGSGLPIDFGLQTAAGSYSVVATNISTGCTKVMSGSVSVAADPLPTVYTVTGGGNYCAGGAGVPVMLSGSNAGIAYQLMNSGSPVGAPMAGTGFALNFGPQTISGNYSVVATNATTLCTSNMSGGVSVGINPLPAVYSVSGSGSTYCAGGGGVNVLLSGSAPGVNYQLYNGATAIGAPKPGTGSPLDFGAMLLSGSYNVVAVTPATGCTNNMSGSVVITINPLPTAFTMTGGGSICNGGSGLLVGLSGSNAGVAYQLYRDGSPVGGVVSGTGGSINFGMQSAGGSYTVVATNPTTTCTNNMTGASTIALSPLPGTYAVTGGGNYCAGTAGVVIGLSGSASGVNYQLFRGTTMVGSAIAGTGGTIDFGSHTVAGNYMVVATNGTTGCVNNMTGSATVGVNPSPAVFAATGGGSFCQDGSGVHVGVSGSSSGFNYQLYNGTAMVGSPVAGTGSGIDFGLQTAAGTYTVVALNTVTGCTKVMTGNASVIVNPLPSGYSVIGGGNYCAGGAGVSVGLSNSNAGINYKLYSDFSLVNTLPGTGAPIDFGRKTVAGNYTVIATNAATGCAANMPGSVTVGITPIVTPFVSVSSAEGDTVCDGSLITYTAVSANEGSSPDYQWSVNGVAAGIGGTFAYTPVNGDIVEVALTSSATCATPATVNGTMTMKVDPVAAPMLGVTANPGVLVCQGTNVTFTGTPSYGGTAPIYSWFKNGTAVGTASTYSYIPANGDVVYCVMTSNYHCRTANSATSASKNMSVALPVVPSVAITANPGLNIAAGQAATFTATATNGGPAPSYQWLVNGVAVAGATMPTFTSGNLFDGDSVTCHVLSSGGCPGLLGSTTVVVRVIGVGVNQVTSGVSDIRLIPNPSKGAFTVKGTLGFVTDEDANIEVTNMLGQTIYSGKATVRNGEVNERIQLSSSIANGMYILNLRSGTESKVFHLVIEQ